MKDNGYAHLSEGALVVDVKEDTDTKEIPPCMILKSTGPLCTIPQTWLLLWSV